MKKREVFAVGMAVLCLLSGCGNDGGAPVDGAQRTTAEQLEAPGTEPRQSAEDSTEPRQSAESGGLPGEQPGGGGAETSPENAELSQEEKDFFTDFIQQSENYGFLLSDYDAPQDVNVREVLYGGAGFGQWIPQEDIPLYLEAVGDEGLYTDCVKMTRQDIETFLQGKLGLGLEDMSSPLDMMYLEATDSYYNQAGDTNYAPFSCVEGTRQGDTYTLRFTPAADWLTGFGDRETMLVKTQDGYRFVSNRTLAD